MRESLRASDALSGSVTTNDTNDADSVVETPASKKLKLLADVDEATRSQTGNSLDDQHQFIFETSAYLDPIELNNEEELSPLTF